MKILAINVGSTSLKFRLFEMPAEIVLASGRIERVGDALSPVSWTVGESPHRREERSCPDQQAAIALALNILTQSADPVLSLVSDLACVAFKAVHAEGIADTVFFDDGVLAAMAEYIPLAPMHNPPYMEAVRVFGNLAPNVPLIGVFEPAFHRTIPDHARTYAIPWRWSEKYRIRRYGFHGASHRYVASRVPQLLGRADDRLRIISCHLGGSSSVCALEAGESRDTSMGFSTQSGLPHATRSGDLDPFVPLYLMQKEQLDPEQLGHILASEGGLSGISGMGGDVRDLERAAAQGDGRAALALDVFVYEIQKYVGAYFVALGGLDVLALTGGIGENGVALRARICAGLGCLGVDIDSERNEAVGSEGVISTPSSPVTVAVIAANEELVIAREAMKLLAGSAMAVSAG